MPEPPEAAWTGQKQSLQLAPRPGAEAGLGSQAALAGWLLHRKASNPHHWPTASSAGSSSPLEQSAKVLFFPSSSLNHLCCGRSQTTAVCSEFESMPSTKDLQSVLSHAEQNKN